MKKEHVVITMETESKTFVAAAGTIAGAKKQIVQRWNDEQRKAAEYFGEAFTPTYVHQFGLLEMQYDTRLYVFDGDGCQVE